jgi:hypothetical protein
MGRFTPDLTAPNTRDLGRPAGFCKPASLACRAPGSSNEAACAASIGDGTVPGTQPIAHKPIRVPTPSVARRLPDPPPLKGQRSVAGKPPLQMTVSDGSDRLRAVQSALTLSE